MFHKVHDITPIPPTELMVKFANGVTKLYDIQHLFSRFPAFQALSNETLFSDVHVDTGGYGIIWNDDLDLSCDELWEHGRVVKTPFDGLMSFADACELWGLSESTLRKAVAYGKLVPGIDTRKFGKQWIVTRRAMNREYGQPVQ